MCFNQKFNDPVYLKIRLGRRRKKIWVQCETFLISVTTCSNFRNMGINRQVLRKLGPFIDKTKLGNNGQFWINAFISNRTYGYWKDWISYFLSLWIRHSERYCEKCSLLSNQIVCQGQMVCWWVWQNRDGKLPQVPPKNWLARQETSVAPLPLFKTGKLLPCTKKKN